MAGEDYPPVSPDDPELLRRFGPPASPTQFDSGSYPPAQPAASALPQGVTAPDYAPVPSATRAPGVAPMFRTTGDVAPTPGEFPAVKPSGWKRALGALAVGAAGFENPAAGKQAEEEVFERPREEAQRQFAGATEAFKGGLAQKKEESEEAQRAAQTKATEAGIETVPVTSANGQVYSVPRKDLEKYLANTNTNQTKVQTVGAQQAGATERTGMQQEGANTREAGKERSAEDIAKMRAESAEMIAKGHDLVSTEVARIRAAAGNDPNKLTNTMKTMKQQAQSTLPGISRALDETEQVANLLGPTAGRWNDFWQGRVGISDPRYAHYKDEIGMVSSAVTLAHARGRMSNELFEHFNKMFDAGKQAPENMIQALNVAQEWLTDYANMGNEPAATPATSAPATGGGFAAWKAKQK